MSSKEGSYVLSSALIFTGVVGLVACGYVSWRVGYSLAEDQIDRMATASILGLADFASAVLIAAGARMRNYGWKARSYAAVLVATAFVGMGYLSAYGFFSTRIAVHEAHKAAVAVETENLKWLRTTTVNTDIPYRQRMAMLAEAKAATKELRKTASVVSDKYAASIASLFSWTMEQAQIRLTIAIAATAYAVKFAGLWFGVMMWPLRKRENDLSVSSSPKGGSGNGGSGVKSSEESKPKQDENVIPLRASEAQPASIAPTPKVSSEPRRVLAIAPRPPVPLTLKPIYASVEDFLARHPSVTSQKVIADAMGVSQAKVSRDIKRLKGRGKVKAEKNWRSNAITFTPRRNGGLHAVI